jgi:hypothetical protein
MLQKNSALAHRKIMQYLAVNLLHRKKKLELVQSISDLETSTDAYFLADVTKMPFIYGNMYEPSSFDYIDTGAYGEIMLKWFPGLVEDEDGFKNVWNNSRRITDVIDCLIDLKDDLNSETLNTFLLTVFYRAKHTQMAIYKNSLDNRKVNYGLKSAVERFTNRTLKQHEKHLSKIDSEDEVVLGLRDRTMKIINFGRDMANGMTILEDPKVANQYHKFYTESVA